MKENKYKIFKYFYPWQKEEEEKWLNEMSSQGWNLYKVNKLGFYHFVRNIESKYGYEYRMELYDKKLHKKEIDNFVEFLKYNNIQRICNTNEWVYFRREKTPVNIEKEFILYNDNYSNVQQVKKFKELLFLIFIACLFIFFINFMYVDLRTVQGPLFAFLSICLVSFFIYGFVKIKQKLNEIKDIPEMEELLKKTKQKNES